MIMDDAFLQKYEQKEQDSGNTAEDNKASESFYNKIRRANNSALGLDSQKVKWIEEHVKRWVGKGERSVIYSAWKGDGVNLIKQVLNKNKINFSVIDGNTDAVARSRRVERYNKGNTLVLLISSAGSEGLDLKKTRHIVLMEPHWNETRKQQVIGRGVRQGSHDGLPEAERVVNVWELRLHKPKDSPVRRFKRESADDIIAEKSKEKEEDFRTNVLPSIIRMSIENQSC